MICHMTRLSVGNSQAMSISPRTQWRYPPPAFLGAGVFPTQITANEVERTRYDALDDMLSTTGSAFLGLSIGCARCHDHKYDPIPVKDYYQLLSTFTTTVRSNIEVDLNNEQNKPCVRNGKRSSNRCKQNSPSMKPSCNRRLKMVIERSTSTCQERLDTDHLERLQSPKQSQVQATRRWLVFGEWSKSNT